MFYMAIFEIFLKGQKTAKPYRERWPPHDLDKESVRKKARIHGPV